MIGVFDSGVGGMTALAELRRLRSSVDITYLADRENAPYGTKSEDKILLCAENCIRRLRDAGAEKILIACCTASTLFGRMSEASKKIAVPIISPAAKSAARATVNGRIAVIATSATVRSRAFTREIRTHRKANLLELEAQPLVAMVEGGARDGAPLSRENEMLLDDILSPIRAFGADTLVLGCTHFSHLEEHISSRLEGVRLISPSREGAIEMAKATENRGSGKTVFI